MPTLLERFLFPLMVFASLLLHGAVAFCCWLLAEFQPAELLTPVPGTNSIAVQVSVASRPKPVEEAFDHALTEMPAVPSPAKAPPAIAKTTTVDDLARPRPNVKPTLPKLTAETVMPTPPESPSLEPLTLPGGKAVVLAETTKLPETTFARPRQQQEKLPALKPEQVVHDAADLPPYDPRLPPVKATEVSPLKTPKDSPEAPKRTMAKAPELKAEKSQVVPPDMAALDPLAPPIKSPITPLKTTTEAPQELPRPATKATLPNFEAVTRMAEPSPFSSDASAASQGVTPDELARTSPSNRPPPYPPDALAAGKQGKVMLHLWIDASGKVTKVAIYTSSGVESLDQSAANTAQSWVFAPARRGSRPVASELLWPVEFFIRNRQ